MQAKPLIRSCMWSIFHALAFFYNFSSALATIEHPLVFCQGPINLALKNKKVIDHSIENKRTRENIEVLSVEKNGLCRTVPDKKQLLDQQYERKGFISIGNHRF